jgi:predicted TIM-barrel enzyme
MITGKNILGARIYAPLLPDVAMAGVAILESVVPKVMAAVPVPVFRIATRNARVGVFVISCSAADGEVVRSKRYVGERILRESMINPYG